MPLALQIIRANEFIRLDPENHLDLEKSKRLLELLVAACRQRGIDQALMDLRRLPVPDAPLFTPTQLAMLVDTFKEAGFREDQRLAVLYRSDPHHGVRTFAFISGLRGCQVRAFEDFEAAVAVAVGRRAIHRTRNSGEFSNGSDKCEGVGRFVNQ